MFVTCFTYWITPFQRICNPLGLNLGICNPLCQHWLSCFFHVSVAKIMVFIQLSKPFSRIANADIQGWRITNPPELVGFSYASHGMLLLHYFADALPSFLIGDSDEVDASGQRSHIDVELVAFALHAGYLLPEHVEHFGLLKVLACDGDHAVGRVGMDNGKSN